MGITRALAKIVFLLSLAVTLGCGRSTETVNLETVSPKTAAPEASQPDVFLISIDTLRADHLGLHGYPRDTSPFLDQLATEGVFIEQAVVATHGTTPSHASMLTSVPQEVHGVALSGRIDDVVPASLRNLPEVFRQAGYATVAVTGGGNVGRGFGFDRGFDIFDDGARSVEDGRTRLLKHLASIDDNKPLFVFFHTYEVHTPYAPPDDLMGHFGSTDSDFPTTSQELVAHAYNAAALTPQDLAHITARYDEGIRHADRVVRQLFDDLRQLGRLDEALVAITSDHGEEFGEHGGLVHRDLLYEELLRVPMIFWGKAFDGSAPPPKTALSLDIAPTLVACANLSVPASWQGHDLLCSPRPQAADAPTISQYGQSRYSVRTSEWKLIVAPSPAGQTTELYNLVSDPSEQHQISAEHPDVVARLMGELRRWRARQVPIVSESDGAQLSDAERQRLEALGYLGHDSGI